MPSEKEILMIAPVPFYFNRGKSIRVRQSIIALLKLGYCIDLLTYPQGRDFKKYRLNIFRPPKLLRLKEPEKPGFNLMQVPLNLCLVAISFLKLLKGNYSAIHAHDVDGVLIGLIAKRLLNSKSPLIYDMHGSFSELNKYYKITRFRSLVEKIEKMLYDHSDKIIMNWPHLKEMIKTQTPKILIMDSPDSDVISYLKEDLDLEEEWANDKYILYTGNYAEYQGIGLLLEAFKKIENEAHLVLTGSPPLKYKVESDRIHYLGFVGRKKLAALMQHADVLVSPRLTDGFPPMKILYYTLTRNAIVVTDKSCHTSILEGVDGVYFSKANAQELASTLRKALNSSIKYVRKDFQSNRQENYKKIYDDL